MIWCYWVSLYEGKQVSIGYGDEAYFNSIADEWEERGFAEWIASEKVFFFYEEIDLE